MQTGKTEEFPIWGVRHHLTGANKKGARHCAPKGRLRDLLKKYGQIGMSYTESRTKKPPILYDRIILRYYSSLGLDMIRLAHACNSSKVAISLLESSF